MLANLVIYRSNFSKLLVIKLIPDKKLPGIIIYNNADTIFIYCKRSELRKTAE